jgi:hypothetical protein
VQLGPECNAELQGLNLSSSPMFQPEYAMSGRSDPKPENRAQSFLRDRATVPLLQFGVETTRQEIAR